MIMALIPQTDTSECLAYKVARTVYYETGGKTLPVVEALTSMIKNLSDKSGMTIEQVTDKSDIFSGKYASGDMVAHRFDMCVRVARRMLTGVLPDMCCGATMFHHGDIIPDWATSRGYIADIDGMLFYL